MQTKFRGLLILMISILSFALIFTFVMAERMTGDNLLLVSPGIGQRAGVDYETLEETIEEKCILAYEVSQEKSVVAVNSRHYAVIRGTNLTYPFVMNYPMLYGGYITEDATLQKLRYAVLNEIAAFEMFGGVDITGNEIEFDGLPYMVVGVMDDGDAENLNVYISISHFDQHPDTFVAVMDDTNGISAEYIKSEFKQLGITETNYDFINLNLFRRVIWEKTVVALALLILTVIFRILRRSAARLRKRIQTIRGLIKQYYLKRLLREKPAELLRLITNATIVLAALGAWVWVFLRLVELLLGWRLYVDIPSIRNIEHFNNIIHPLQDITAYSNVFFIAFIATMLLYIVYCDNASRLDSQK